MQYDRSHDREFVNILSSLITLEQQIDTQIIQINPSEDLKIRNKRGLIDPLGSLIKCITGNLDQSDALKYDTQIKLLQENQNKLKISAINQITLLNSTISKFQTIISNISHNQLALKSKITQVEDTIRNEIIYQNHYIKVHMLIQEITTFYQVVFNVFQKIETAISFAKFNTLHNAIIDPINLLKEIQNIQHQLKLNVLPFEATENNIAKFEQIITLKCYSKDFVITFILELPLVEPKIYQFYQLHPVPIPLNKSSNFKIIVPHKPYLALEDSKFAYIDQPCNQIKSEEFLCTNAHSNYIGSHPPCEVQLITYKPHITTCQLFQVQLEEIQVKKIGEDKWLITVPQQVIAITTCDNAQTKVPLSGSYLLQSPPNCNAQIGPFLLQSYKSSELTFNKIRLPQLNLSDEEDGNKIIFNPPELKLDAVNIKETREIQTKLLEQKTQLQEMSIPVYYARTSVWTIVLYVLVIFISVIVLSKFIAKKYCRVNPDQIQENQIIV